MLRDPHESLETQRQYIQRADDWARGLGQSHLLEEYRELREYLWELDLSPAWPVLVELYSQRGRPAINPLLLLRISLVRRVLRIDSRDEFIELLRLSPYPQILSGLDNQPVPGASALRDFERRVSNARRRGVELPVKRSKGGREDLLARVASFLERLWPKAAPSEVGILGRLQWYSLL